MLIEKAAPTRPNESQDQTRRYKSEVLYEEVYLRDSLKQPDFKAQETKCEPKIACESVVSEECSLPIPCEYVPNNFSMQLKPKDAELDNHADGVVKEANNSEHSK